MKLNSLHDLCSSWHLHICSFLFSYLTFLPLYSCLWRTLHVVLHCIRRNFKSWAIRQCYGKFLEDIHVMRSAWFLLLSACPFVDVDTSVICHVLMYHFCSFLHVFSVFTSHVIKSKNCNHSMNKVKNHRYDRWLIYKQPRQESGLCCFSFASYLQKRVTQIYRALYGDPMFVPSEVTQTWWRKVLETSVTEFCYWNEKLLL